MPEHALSWSEGAPAGSGGDKWPRPAPAEFEAGRGTRVMGFLPPPAHPPVGRAIWPSAQRGAAGVGKLWALVGLGLRVVGGTRLIRLTPRNLPPVIPLRSGRLSQ